jgi:hypothetical protein
MADASLGGLWGADGGGEAEGERGALHPVGDQQPRGVEVLAGSDGKPDEFGTPQRFVSIVCPAKFMGRACGPDPYVRIRGTPKLCPYLFGPPISWVNP